MLGVRTKDFRNHFQGSQHFLIKFKTNFTKSEQMFMEDFRAPTDIFQGAVFKKLESRKSNQFINFRKIRKILENSRSMS